MRKVPELDQGTYIIYPGTDHKQRGDIDFGPDWEEKNADQVGIKFHNDSKSAMDLITIANIQLPNDAKCSIQYANKLGHGCHEIVKKPGSLHIQYGIASLAVKHRPMSARKPHMSIVYRTYSNKYRIENRI